MEEATKSEAALLVGDEFSRAGTSIARLREHAYDAFTRRQYAKAMDLMALISKHADNAQCSLWARIYAAHGQHDLAKRSMALYDRTLSEQEVKIRERQEEAASPRI